MFYLFDLDRYLSMGNQLRGPTVKLSATRVHCPTAALWGIY